MSHQNSIAAFLATDKETDSLRVFRYISGSNENGYFPCQLDISEYLKMPRQTVSARITGLKKKGFIVPCQTVIVPRGDKELPFECYRKWQPGDPEPKIKGNESKNMRKKIEFLVRSMENRMYDSSEVRDMLRGILK